MALKRDIAPGLYPRVGPAVPYNDARAKLSRTLDAMAPEKRLAVIDKLTKRLYSRQPRSRDLNFDVDLAELSK